MCAQFAIKKKKAAVNMRGCNLMKGRSFFLRITMFFFSFCTWLDSRFYHHEGQVKFYEDLNTEDLLKKKKRTHKIGLGQDDDSNYL